MRTCKSETNETIAELAPPNYRESMDLRKCARWELLEFAYVRVRNCRIKEKVDLSTPVRIAGAQIWLVLDESQELLEGQDLLGVQRGHVAHLFAVDMFVAGFTEHYFVVPGRNEAL
jgi:hypothetical protein